MIELKNLTVGYHGGAILENVTLAFRQNEVTVLLGPNGFGKSTLMKTALGLLPKISGEVLYDGVPLDKMTYTQVAKQAAYMVQSRAVPSIVARRMVLHGRFAYLSFPRHYRKEDKIAVQKALERVDALEIAERQWSAMGSTANITARALAKTLTGTPTPYGGCLGTGVVRLLPTLNAGRTGLTLQQAKNAGFDAVSALFVTDDKAHYYPNSSSFVVKIIADKASHRLLGLQVLGAGAVDKMIDIAVAGIGKKAKIEDFDTLDFAYAPSSHARARRASMASSTRSSCRKSFTSAFTRATTA